jgi:hypothetical protein
MLYPPYPPELTAKYGFVRRARRCYLYTQSGKRLTDMYQEAGRAILGWEGDTARRVFKNTLNRGAAGSFESQEAFQLEKAIRKLLPGFPVIRWYAGASSALITHWRPWLHTCSVLHGEDIPGPAVLLLPPFPFILNSVILAARDEQTIAQIDQSGAALCPLQVPLFPPCLLAAITRSIYDLMRELPERNEAGWKRYDRVLEPYWNRRGPYLFPRLDRTSYAGFAAKCLDAGLVISPDFDIPSIIPWQADAGDFTGLSHIAV